ncbi:hypothetical protein K474DRAFT_1680480 [Panus rudis PR-1116 ss-1]|nr:hypothetical protein K474DRAFT_1680480 [Panus rudis PR-1116 ss-1]
MASTTQEQSRQLSPVTTTTTANSPTDLRHITSNGNLASPNTKEHRLSKRTSQHLRTHRVGSRSPTSIPSSPTSVHSSSSAIFERDIEPVNPSPPLISNDPHHIPRARHTEPLDQSVPSVLDSAAEVLTTSTTDDDGLDSISIVAPIPVEGNQSGFTSPISRLSSRSPSPTGTNNRRSILLNIPSPSPSFTLPLPLQQQQQQQQQSQPTESVASSSPSRPTVRTDAPIGTNISTPTSAYFSVHSEDSSPTTATHHEHPLHSLSPTAVPSPTSPSASALTATTAGSHPPSPKHSNKRLSFISYTDLLSSTPAATVPLSSLVTAANEPPPHLPSVIGLPQAQAMQSGSSAGSLHDAAGALVADPTSGILDDVGGEWEREGLGRGLEERLEALMPVTGKA